MRNSTQPTRSGSRRIPSCLSKKGLFHLSVHAGLSFIHQFIYVSIVFTGSSLGLSCRLPFIFNKQSNFQLNCRGIGMERLEPVNYHCPWLDRPILWLDRYISPAQCMVGPPLYWAILSAPGYLLLKLYLNYMGFDRSFVGPAWPNCSFFIKSTTNNSSFFQISAPFLSTVSFLLFFSLGK